MHSIRLSVIVLLLTLTASGREARVTVLATTDLHGNIFPWDYLSGKPANRGLAKLATLIEQERKSSPDALLVDAGDTIQGAPLETVWQTYVHTGKLPRDLRFTGPAPTKDPMMLAMNHLRYDAMTVGNHEFNYGLANLDRARGEADFPWLAANVVASEGRKKFEPLLIKQVDGVRIAVIGVTTPAVPSWEKPENFRDYKFGDAVAAVARNVSEVRKKEKADVVILVAHAGLERDLKTGALRDADLKSENMVHRIATEVPGIDAVIFGHTHSELGEHRIGEVLLTQPKNWGMSLARVDVTLESLPEGGWRVTGKNSRVIPVTAGTPADPEILRLAKPYHDVTEAWLNSIAGQSATAMNASTARIEDTPIIDAIQQVQLHYAKADVSFASAFNPRASIPAGPITIRQIAGLYIYDNELYAIEGTGRMVREAIENAARFYNTCRTAECSTGPLINRSFIGYNLDMVQGLSYEIDLTRPAGQRVRNLQFRGRPLEDAVKIRIALNNYRAGGSGGYEMFRGAPVLWRSYENIRELMIRYYGDHQLPSASDNNWKIVPDAARQELGREIRAESRRFLTQ